MNKCSLRNILDERFPDVAKGSEDKEGDWKVVKPKMAIKKIVKIGNFENSKKLIISVKKARLHLGKLKEGNSIEDIDKFISKCFPSMKVSMSKLESKCRNCSLNLRRFLFPRRVAVLPS